MKTRNWLIAGLVGATALALASNSNLTLRTGTIGSGAVAKWIVNSDSKPADHVLLLAKNVPTSENEAAGADIQRIAGTLHADLQGLSWDLEAGPAGGGSPRWNVYYGQPGAGIEGYSFLQPAAYDANGVGTVSAAEIQAPTDFVGRQPMPGDVIYYLQVIVDEQEQILLDDLGVNIAGDWTVFGGPGKSK